MGEIVSFPGPEPTPEERAYFGLKYRLATRLPECADEALLVELWHRAGCPMEPSLDQAIQAARLSSTALAGDSP